MFFTLFRILLYFCAKKIDPQVFTFQQDIIIMGNNFLDKPITTKKLNWEQNQSFKYASCQMQGWRKNMEDAYIAYNSIPGYDDIALYGVFDGHGGGQVSKYVAAHFLQVFLKRKVLPEGKIGQALTETFIQVELMMKMKPGKDQLLRYKGQQLKRAATEGQLNAGATAVVVAVTKDKIVCANAGDSRAALCQEGKCVALSIDHKPENPVQKQRIQKTGVPIVQGRVNGLNLTRSIGDFGHKTVPGLAFNQQPITCMPDIIEVERTGKEEMIVVACDGIWQKYDDDSPKLIKEFKESLKTLNSSEVLKAFFDRNLNPGTSNTDPYGRDNMTAIIVQFKK